MREKRLKNVIAQVCAVAVLCAGTALAADPAISVSIRQRYPWNGLVDINFTITGEEGTRYYTSFAADDVVGGTNIAMQTIRKADGSLAVAIEALLPGNYKWVWDAAADLPKNWKCDELTVSGTALDSFSYSVKFNANGGTGTMANESFTSGTAQALTANAFTRTGYTFQGWATSASGAKVYNDGQSVSNLTETIGGVVNLYAVWKARLYMVINLSSGSSSTSYPISYLDAVPDGGWADIHKSTRLILRRCEAGTFKMQGSKNVTLTKPFYIGVFEMTQKQYKQVTGENPSSSSSGAGGQQGDTRPVYKVSYNMIRGSSNGAKWPSSSAVDSSSFMGKLRSRTGIDFDLPTEAQWEYACRAGTTTAYYWGNSMNGSYAWCNANSTPSKSPYSVGGKKANAWGLYDMSGNVMELCIDWSGTLSYGVDPKGPSSGNKRVARGGSWQSNEEYCTSAQRNFFSPSVVDNYGYGIFGFRLCLTLSN